MRPLKTLSGVQCSDFIEQNCFFNVLSLPHIKAPAADSSPLKFFWRWPLSFENVSQKTSPSGPSCQVQHGAVRPLTRHLHAVYVANPPAVALVLLVASVNKQSCLIFVAAITVNVHLTDAALPLSSAPVLLSLLLCVCVINLRKMQIVLKRSDRK